MDGDNREEDTQDGSTPGGQLEDSSHEDRRRRR